MKTAAVFRFRGAPGREKDAALAWGFELRYYFLRGIGDEPPEVVYENGVYTCSGPIITTHPGDRFPMTVFNDGAQPVSLDFVLDPERMASLRELYKDRTLRFDGTCKQPQSPGRQGGIDPLLFRSGW